MSPPDPHQMMLRKAGEDAQLAAKLAPDASVSDEHLGFFCQQAVEKSIKCVLSYKGVSYRRTHDLSELFQMAAENAIDFPRELSASVILTPFAVTISFRPQALSGTASTVRVRCASHRWRWNGRRRP